MAQPNGNGTRPPLSPAGNGATSASTALQTGLIVYAVSHSGLAGTPAEVQAVALGVAAAWAFLCGVVGRVCRDELHRRTADGMPRCVLREIALTLGSALG